MSTHRDYESEVHRRDILDGYDATVYAVHYFGGVEDDFRLERSLNRESAHDTATSYNTAMEALEKVSSRPTGRAEPMFSTDNGVSWEPDLHLDDEDD